MNTTTQREPTLLGITTQQAIDNLLASRAVRRDNIKNPPAEVIDRRVKVEATFIIHESQLSSLHLYNFLTERLSDTMALNTLNVSPVR